MGHHTQLDSLTSVGFLDKESKAMDQPRAIAMLCQQLASISQPSCQRHSQLDCMLFVGLHHMASMAMDQPQAIAMFPKWDPPVDRAAKTGMVLCQHLMSCQHHSQLDCLPFASLLDMTSKVKVPVQENTQLGHAAT
jgi:hypothetical protein